MLSRFNQLSREVVRDQCGAVAFEMPAVVLLLLLSFIVPLADFTIYGYRYISAFQALRDAGQYLQYHPPADVASGTYTLPATVATIGQYAITGLNGTSTVQLVCNGAKCSSANAASPKYYTFQTSYTLSPTALMKPLLCTSGQTNPCTFTLAYTERFQ